MLDRLEREAGISAVSLRARLGRLRNGSWRLTEEQLIGLEAEIQVIEEAADRNGL
jgi:hypothetical protein